MAEISMADIVALGEKLEAAGVTDAEKALLNAAMDITAKAIADGAEVEGYSFETTAPERFVVNSTPQPGGLATGFRDSFSTITGGDFNPAASVYILQVAS